MSNAVPNYIYLMRAEVGGPIKIGCSSMPERRLREMSVWSPFRLLVLARLPGSRTIEAKLHAYFTAEHDHGEWFTASKRVLEFTDAMMSGASLSDALPDLDEATKNTKRPAGMKDQHARLRQSYACRLMHAVVKVTGSNSAYRSHLPIDVQAMMVSWGHYGALKHLATGPTPEHCARMDEILANPEAHVLRAPFKYTPPAEQGAAQ